MIQEVVHHEPEPPAGLGQTGDEAEAS